MDDGYLNAIQLLASFGGDVFHRHLVCLSSQIDRHGRTAVHGERGLGCAGAPMRAAARPPHRQLETHPTTIGAGEARAGVWMLLSMVIV
jgi:hypothetical protein